MKEKKPIWKKWWFWVIIVIFVGVIGSIGSSDNEPKKTQVASEETATKKEDGEKTEDTDGKEAASNEDTSKDEKDTEDTSESEEVSKEEEFYIGDEITMGEYVLTVDKVKQSSGTEYDKPKKGSEYLIVSVTIKNNGEDEISYNPYNFSVQNGEGQVNDIAFTTVNTDTSLSSGELVGGGSVSGTLAFEVPKNDKKLLLRYQPDFLSDKEIQIHLQKKK